MDRPYLKQVREKQQSGYCAKIACLEPRDPGLSLCKAHWLALPIDYRRAIIRAQNAYQATHSEENRDRFRAAWMRAVKWTNAPAEEVIPTP